MSENTENNNHYSLANKIITYAASAALALGLAGAPGCGTAPKYADDMDREIGRLVVDSLGDKKEFNEQLKLIREEIISKYPRKKDRETLEAAFTEYKRVVEELEEFPIDLPESYDPDVVTTEHPHYNSRIVSPLTHTLDEDGRIVGSRLVVRGQGHYTHKEGDKEKRVTHTVDAILEATDTSVSLTYQLFSPVSEGRNLLRVQFPLQDGGEDDEYRTIGLLKEALTVDVAGHEDYTGGLPSLTLLLERAHPFHRDLVANLHTSLPDRMLSDIAAVGSANATWETPDLNTSPLTLTNDNRVVGYELSGRDLTAVYSTKEEDVLTETLRVTWFELNESYLDSVNVSLTDAHELLGKKEEKPPEEPDTPDEPGKPKDPEPPAPEEPDDDEPVDPDEED